VISGINGTVLLSRSEAVLEGMDFRFMHGRARCGGRLSVEDGVVQMSLNGEVSDLIFPLFSGFDPRVGGSWRLEGPVDDLRLSGDLAVSRAVLRRREDLTTILLDWIEESAGAGAASAPTLDLRIEADNTIEARGPLLNLMGSAALNLSGTPDALGLTGKLEFAEGGDFSFQGVRYELESGSITFSDPNQIDPFIDLQARAWVQNYQITVRLTGTMDRLVPTVSSDPPLEEAGIYSLLALGHRNEAVGGGAIGVGLASSVLTRQLNEAIDERSRLVLPVDQVLLDPFVESSTGSPAARVTLVKQLSPTWTVIVQSNLAKERQEVIVSRWYLAPGLFVEATRDLDGSLGVDLKLRRRY
jgi:translocation and assembly module TamB